MPSWKSMTLKRHPTRSVVSKKKTWNYKKTTLSSRWMQRNTKRGPSMSARSLVSSHPRPNRMNSRKRLRPKSTASIDSSAVNFRRSSRNSRMKQRRKKPRSRLLKEKLLKSLSFKSSALNLKKWLEPWRDWPRNCSGMSRMIQRGSSMRRFDCR